MPPCVHEEAESLQLPYAFGDSFLSLCIGHPEHPSHPGDEAKPASACIIEHSDVLASHCRSLRKRVEHSLQDTWTTEGRSTFSSGFHTPEPQDLEAKFNFDMV